MHDEDEEVRSDDFDMDDDMEGMHEVTDEAFEKDDEDSDDPDDRFH